MATMVPRNIEGMMMTSGGEEEEMRYHNEKHGKSQRIFKAIDEPNRCGYPHDLWKLREFALTRGGLINSELRIKIWPLFVGLGPPESYSMLTTDLAEEDKLPPKELDLIRRDASRSVLYRYYKTNKKNNNTTPTAASTTPPPDTPTGELTSQCSLSFAEQQDQLTSVLEAAVAGGGGGGNNKQQYKIHYYQGLHDIAGVIMYNLMEDVDLSTAILRRVCQNHLREAVRENFHPLLWFLNKVLMPLLGYLDEELHQYLLEVGVEISNAILPWIITWFTHDVHDEEVASRLVDAFLCSHALLPLYVTVAMLIHPLNKHQLMYQTECDAAMVHMVMRKFPNQIVTDFSVGATLDDTICAQDLLDDALYYMKQVPPRSLLDLVVSYDACATNDDELKLRANHLSLLKAPPSWALAGTPPARRKQRRSKTAKVGIHENSNESSPPTSLPSPPTPTTMHPYARSKVASGVTMLMKTIPRDVILSSRLQGTYEEQQDELEQDCGPRRLVISSLWQIYKRAIFGSSIRKEIRMRREEEEEEGEAYLGEYEEEYQ